MKNVILSFLFLAVINNAIAQQHALTKEWDKRFGGTLPDEMSICLMTPDNGYLLGGASYSRISGDKTQDNWDTTSSTYDFWVVKTDAGVNKVWDKHFGGTDDDGLQPSSLQVTIDGGYVLAGVSASGISGDKTQTNRGGFDYWLVKIDSNGNKIWDKRFGGILDDYLYVMRQTKDRGYVMGGTSYSPIGGDKTHTNWGSKDYWVVKTDSVGNKQWDADFGGTALQDLRALLQTDDGGYILGGSSTSDSSGDKTEANWGYWNYWIVKTDIAGNKLWDKRFGSLGEDGLVAMIQTKDGGFLLGGLSNSGIGGDKTQNTQGGDDY